MLVPELKGGLGNQMFTIAATYAKSLELNCEFGINYSLPHYAMQGNSPKIYKDSLYSKMLETNYIPQFQYKEPSWSYSPLPNNTDMLVCGYLQSEKYFLNHKDDIKQLFEFNEKIIEKCNKNLQTYKKQKIGLHVRLGDYLKTECRSIHFLCTPEYYKTALKNFDLKDYDVLVFTDDLNNCKKLLSDFSDNIVINSSDIEDMYFLTQCDIVVMSNSTFSWWGAYLGKNKQKIYAPSRWFGPGGPSNYSDIYNLGWELIPV